MNYYVVDTTNGDSLLFDTDKAKLQSSITKFKPELKGQPIQETEREIILLNGVYVFADEHQEEIDAQKELEEQQKAYDENQEAINALKDDLLTATLMGDEDWIADLKAEYAELTEGE